jgi:hypothetical protein
VVKAQFVTVNRAEKRQQRRDLDGPALLALLR